MKTGINELANLPQSQLPAGISSVYSDGQDFYYGIEEIPIYGNKASKAFGNTESNGNVGDFFKSYGDFVSDIIKTMWGWITGERNIHLQNQYNVEMYERQLADSILAEQRTNEEYDRRVADQRAYDEGWASRLLAQGFNPLALLSKGQGITSSSFSAPQIGSTPNAPVKTSPLMGLSTTASILDVLSQMKLRNSQAENIDADTRQKGQEISAFWDRFALEMENLTSTVKNRDSETRINTLTAQFKEATLGFDFVKAQYSAQQAYYEMERSGVSVEQAKADLSFRLNAVAQQAIQSQLMEQQLDLNSVTLDQLVTTWNANKHLVDEQAQANLSLLNERVRSVTKANNWYAVNQVVGSISSIGSTVSSLVNAFKPFPQITSTYTERSTIGEFGNVLGSTTEFRQNTYSK